MITRRNVVLAASIGLLAAHPLGRAQPAATVRRVGWLSFGTEANVANLYAPLKQGMEERGWVEGKNVEYRIVYANSDSSRLDTLARDLVGQKVDVILVGNGQSAFAAQRATKSIPIVMAGLANAMGTGLVAGLAKPGGNVTGLTSQQDELIGKVIGILHEVAPGARRHRDPVERKQSPTRRVLGRRPGRLRRVGPRSLCGLWQARPRNSAPPSSRSFDNARRPS